MPVNVFVTNSENASDIYTTYSQDKTFVLDDLGVSSMRIRVDCINGSYTHTFPTDLPIGYTLYYILSDVDDSVPETPTSLTVIFGDGLSQFIHDVDDVKDSPVGDLIADQAGEFILVKESEIKWRQVRSLPFGGVIGATGADGADGATGAAGADGADGSVAATLPFAQITSTPTTLAGYGITDAATSAQGVLADSAAQSSVDGNSTDTNFIWVGSQANYDALVNGTNTDPNTLYFINS